MPFRANLEAFAVDDGRTRFVIFLFGDPHSLESRQRSQDGATNPDGVFTFRRSNNLDLHRGRGQSSNFLLHTFSNTIEHSGTTGQHGVAIQILSNVNIAFHDRIISSLVDARLFKTDQRGLEEDLRASETLVADSDHLTIRQFVALFQVRGLGGLPSLVWNKRAFTKPLMTLL